MKPVKKMFAELEKDEIIKENPCEKIKRLKVQEERARGCYELEQIKGVFNRRWKDERAYLLCMMIYTTGMRNCEIKNVKLEDIKKINGCRFAAIEKSKTKAGERIIPVHEHAYRRLKAWAVKNNIEESSVLFNKCHVDVFSKANKELAGMLKVSEEELKRENITFYSGRHYWKTLMNAEGLGEDIEEIFMGHKVSSDVKKRYNHRDKQGKKMITKKAKQVYRILDECIFKKDKAARACPRGRRGGGVKIFKRKAYPGGAAPAARKKNGQSKKKRAG